MAANSLKANNSWLGDYFRRMKSKGGHNYLVGTEAFHIVEGRYEAADALMVIGLLAMPLCFLFSSLWTLHGPVRI